MKGSKKIAVGMSGGVDSAVSAWLLKKEGYDVTGVFIEAWNEPGCRTPEDREDALKAALKIGIPFTVVDAKKEYGDKIVKYFYDSYENGLTPNPDILCNSVIKFGLFYEWAEAHGFDAVATGHYAQVDEVNGRREILVPVDEKKDQTYFLYKLKEEKLGEIIFPLGKYRKSEVRKMAKEAGIAVADKPDSMGVCFIGKENVQELLRKKLGSKPGDVLYKGEVVGRHKGIWFHTIGQRGGFEVDKRRLKAMGESTESMNPLYVIGKIVGDNQIIVGSRDECNAREFEIDDVNLVHEGENIEERRGYLVRIRNLGEMVECKVEGVGGGRYRIKTKEPMFAVSPGQSAVFYHEIDGKLALVGGGVIA